MTFEEWLKAENERENIEIRKHLESKGIHPVTIRCQLRDNNDRYDDALMFYQEWRRTAQNYTVLDTYGSFSVKDDQS